MGPARSGHGGAGAAAALGKGSRGRAGWRGGYCHTPIAQSFPPPLRGPAAPALPFARSGGSGGCCGGGGGTAAPCQRPAALSPRQPRGKGGGWG